MSGGLRSSVAPAHGYNDELDWRFEYEGDDGTKPGDGEREYVGRKTFRLRARLWAWIERIGGGVLGCTGISFERIRSSDESGLVALRFPSAFADGIELITFSGWGWDLSQEVLGWWFSGCMPVDELGEGATLRWL